MSQHLRSTFPLADRRVVKAQHLRAFLKAD